MTGEPETDGRPRWRKKRWWAAGLLWLAVVYVAGDGPFIYVAYREWVPIRYWEVAYGWTRRPLGHYAPSLGTAYNEYVRWVVDAANRHRLAASD